MENTLFKPRRPATMRERVESRRDRRNKGLLSLLALRQHRAAQNHRDAQPHRAARTYPEEAPIIEVVPYRAYLPPPPPRPARSRRETQAVRHFEQLQHPRQGSLPRQGLPQQGSRFWQGLPHPGLLDGIDLRAWLPRVLAVLVMCLVGVGIWLIGCNVGKARAAAIPVAATPTPTAKPKPKPSGKTTILVLGSDQRPEDKSFRTDVIILLTINPAKNTVSALSFPRDLVAKVPGYGDDRINVVMQYGGFKLMQDTMEKSYGVRPQYYFMTNFAGVVGLVNSIGGIDVYAAQPLTDACDLYWSRAGTCEIKKGKHAMDGDTALWYIRSRHSSSDFDRLRRAQEVMLGIYQKLISSGALARVPELYRQYRKDVETNMPAAKVLQFLPVAAQVAKHPSLVRRYTIPEEVTADWFMFNGARVLLPDYEKVKQIVQDALAAK